jgi:hypothetical protein
LNAPIYEDKTKITTANLLIVDSERECVPRRRRGYFIGNNKNVCAETQHCLDDPGGMTRTNFPREFPTFKKELQCATGEKRIMEEQNVQVIMKYQLYIYTFRMRAP